MAELEKRKLHLPAALNSLQGLPHVPQVVQQVLVVSTSCCFCRRCLVNQMSSLWRVILTLWHIRLNICVIQFSQVQHSIHKTRRQPENTTVNEAYPVYIASVDSTNTQLPKLLQKKGTKKTGFDATLLPLTTFCRQHNCRQSIKSQLLKAC